MPIINPLDPLSWPLGYKPQAIQEIDQLLAEAARYERFAVASLDVGFRERFRAEAAQYFLDALELEEKLRKEHANG